MSRIRTWVTLARLRLPTADYWVFAPPMHGGEEPVVRPYVLVDDIEATVAAAAESGAHIAVPPMEIAGHGRCTIVFHGGIQSGFWQL